MCCARNGGGCKPPRPDCIGLRKLTFTTVSSVSVATRKTRCIYTGRRDVSASQCVSTVSIQIRSNFIQPDHSPQHHTHPSTRNSHLTTKYNLNIFIVQKNQTSTMHALINYCTIKLVQQWRLGLFEGRAPTSILHEKIITKLEVEIPYY